MLQQVVFNQLLHRKFSLMTVFEPLWSSNATPEVVPYGVTSLHKEFRLCQNFLNYLSNHFSFFFLFLILLHLTITPSPSISLLSISPSLSLSVSVSHTLHFLSVEKAGKGGPFTGLKICQNQKKKKKNLEVFKELWEQRASGVRRGVTASLEL